ncbi:uncharacterized protein LOC124812466 [Hydra vulgaris]|uniref:uncharacterized protein LOC124812466 n=1 Tax=Hydra vulgaris TaxID=6087 RepID=UPI0032E9D6D5
MDRNIESKTFKNISFCAYNCQSFKLNSIYISELVKSFDIIFLSEHWLLNIELFVLKNIALPTHKVFFHAAEKKAFGRPFGGNAFIIKKDVILSPHIIYEDDNILAIKGKNKCHNLVFIGIYLTSCRNNEESFSKNEQQLNLITSIVKNYEDVSECIIAGDFQSYPETLYDSEIRNNKKRNKFSNHLTNFIKSNKLSFIDIISGAGPTYTYQHKTLSNSSYIDHIAVLKESSLLFINTSVIPPSPFNFSDHLPNATNIVVTHTNLSTVINSIMHKYNCIPKYAWNNEKFINIYNHNLSAAFNYYTFNEEEIEQELKQTGEKIQNAALLAVKQCFKQQIYIVQEFRQHFQTLLNTPLILNNNHNPSQIPSLSKEPKSLIITSADIINCISKLNSNKSPDSYGLSAEHLKNSHNNNLLLWLAKFYNSILSNGKVPNDLSTSTIIPLVKSYKKSLNNPDNYRGISILPIFTKLLEYLILQKCPSITDSHSHQFGFKKNSSTLHAEFLLSETVMHYKNNNTPLYMCSLDANKAFDTCNWDLLFEKLILNEIVSECKVGSTINGVYTGVIAYADDVILLSPTISGLQELINRFQTYGVANFIKLNTEKTEFLISGKSFIPNNVVKVNGVSKYLQNKLKHLGFQ